ncbi:hypothetical protein IWW38_002983, partial [Coemansia aciculifera]
MSLDILKLESMMRVYIGLIWFYPHPPTSTLAEAAQQVQVGVDKVVAATPVLGGTLREAAPVRIDYTEDNKVQVYSVSVPYTYAELEESGFDQNKFSQIFDVIPSITPDLEGLRVLRVWVFGLSCGGVAVAIASHHALGDGAAAAEVAMRISRACISPEKQQPPAMWSSRSKMRQALKDSLKGDEVVDDSFGRHLSQLTSTGSLKTSGQVGSHQFALRQESLHRLKELAIQSGEQCSTNDM